MQNQPYTGISRFTRLIPRQTQLESINHSNWPYLRIPSCTGSTPLYQGFIAELALIGISRFISPYGTFSTRVNKKPELNPTPDTDQLTGSTTPNSHLALYRPGAFQLKQPLFIASKAIIAIHAIRFPFKCLIGIQSKALLTQRSLSCSLVYLPFSSTNVVLPV